LWSDLQRKAFRRIKVHSIRKAEMADIPNVLDLWNDARPYDEIEPSSVKNFFSNSDVCQPELTLLAEVDGELAGFIIGTVRNGLNGIISVFFVDPGHSETSLADDLLGKVMSRFEKAGVARVVAGTAWETGLSMCGFDTRYTDILNVFKQNGFKPMFSDEELDGDILKDLVDFEIPNWVSDARISLEADGYSFGMCQDEMKQQYVEFMDTHFTGYGGWRKRARDYLASAEDPGFHLLAFHDNSIVGFTENVFDEGWQMHATGVRTDLRGKKIGCVLVFLALEEIKKRGADSMFIGECPLDFYGVVDGQILRRYALLEKKIAGAK